MEHSIARRTCLFFHMPLQLCIHGGSCIYHAILISQAHLISDHALPFVLLHAANPSSLFHLESYHLIQFLPVMSCHLGHLKHELNCTDLLSPIPQPQQAADVAETGRENTHTHIYNCLFFVIGLCLFSLFSTQ